MGTNSFDHLPISAPPQRALLLYTTVCEVGERVRIGFCGEVDLASADVVGAAVTDALRSYRPRYMDVDLSGVNFLDARGVSTLLCCWTRAVELGCELAVINPQPMVYRILEITGVLATLGVRPVRARPMEP